MISQEGHMTKMTTEDSLASRSKPPPQRTGPKPEEAAKHIKNWNEQRPCGCKSKKK